MKRLKKIFVRNGRTVIQTIALGVVLFFLFSGLSLALVGTLCQ